MRNTITVTFTSILLSTIFTSSAFAAINAADYGVSASNGDNAAALEAAFKAGKGQEVILPAGTIRYSREVRADSVRIKGNGTVMAPSNPDNQRIYLTGSAPSISDVRFDFKPTRRSGKGVEKAGVWVQGAKGFTVQNVTFNGHANGKPTEHGVGGGNLFVKGSTGGQILNNKLYGTLADAIHLTGGARNVTVAGNYIENASDDGIAVVNYKDGSGDVKIQGNTVVGNRWGRNITAVGASDVQIVDNYVKGNSSDGAGIYIASEKSYGTAAPKNILVQGNSLQDTGGPGKGHGQLMIYAGNGAIDGVTVKDNEIRDSKRDDLAVVVSGSTRDVVMEGNNIDGEISRRGSGNFVGNGNTVNDARMASAAPVPNRPPVPVSSGWGPDGNQFGRNVDGLVENAANTDEEFWRAVEYGETDALRRLNDLVSGGILVRQGNAIINRVTGQIVSTVNRTIGNAVDAVMQPVEDAVSSLGDAIICGIGGGWVAALIGINICAAKQLKIEGKQLTVQEKQLSEQRKMVMPTIWGNELASAEGIETTVRALTAGRQVYNPGSVPGDYGKAYPAAYDSDRNNEDMISESAAMLDRQRQSQIAAQVQQAANVTTLRQRPGRIAEIMQATQAAPGQTAAIQESVKMGALTVEAISTLHSDIIAAERARMNEMAREQQDRALEERTFENAMAGWGECKRCGNGTVGWEK